MSLNVERIAEMVITAETKVEEEAPLVRDFITNLKGSPYEALAEKMYPGIATAEDEALRVVNFLLTITPVVDKWLKVLFPKAA